MRLKPSKYTSDWRGARLEWRPTGVGRGITTYTIPIEGRDDWLASAEVRSA